MDPPTGGSNAPTHAPITWDHIYMTWPNLSPQPREHASRRSLQSLCWPPSLQWRCFVFLEELKITFYFTPVYARRVDSSALVFSLSSHRHSYT
jgi:hypothetical protein